MTEVTTIAPPSGWTGLGLREIWAYRELLYFLVWRDIKVRYRQTAFGALWALIQPVALMLVFTAFLGRVAQLSEGDVPYPLFALAGLIPWTLVAQGVTGSAGSLVDATNLVQKVYFPRLLLPIAAIGSYVVNFLIATVLLLVVLVAEGFPPSVEVVWVAPFTLLAMLTTASIGIFLSALNVRYRDVRHAVPFLVQLWLFASPVAYSARLIPKEWIGLYRLNPMTGVIEGFRWAFLGGGGPFPFESLGVSAAVTSVVLLGSLAYFRAFEQTFADVI